MKTNFKHITIALCTIGITISACTQAHSEKNNVPTEGQEKELAIVADQPQEEHFAVKDEKGNTITLAELKGKVVMLKDQLPDDVEVRYEFDQSKYISRALSNLIHEGLLGALFTGLMILLFLGDSRGALIVVLTIPIAILAAVSMLHLLGYTINMMTLSGLALSIGILVDEATVTIENIHQHLEAGKPKQRAILDALLEISIPKLLILLCILAVLTPAFIMTGIPKDMFLPLSMAVAFAMIASFLASHCRDSRHHGSCSFRWECAYNPD